MTILYLFAFWQTLGYSLMPIHQYKFRLVPFGSKNLECHEFLHVAHEDSMKSSNMLSEVFSYVNLMEYYCNDLSGKFSRLCCGILCDCLPLLSGGYSFIVFDIVLKVSTALITLIVMALLKWNP